MTFYRGTFVIPVDRTETDGLRAAPLSAVAVGSVWSWWGQPVRIDGPAHLLTLDGAAARADLRPRAAHAAARLLGPGHAFRAARRAPVSGDPPREGFTVSDGVASYDLAPAGPGLLTVSGALPPARTELAVLARRGHGPAVEGEREGEWTGTAGLTPGIRIATPGGPRPALEIRPGDRILTCDGGAEEVLWTGARRISGARLHAMPWLRPVRIRAGALGPGTPDSDLVVAPGQRVLVTGAAARDLFAEAGVLVAARDLVDGRGIVVDGPAREVTYLHLLTARHEVIRADGIAAETFHPAAADTAALDPAERAGLLAALAGDPARYGGFARRRLSAPEAAILRHATA